jgi:5S rRNA maturation endonuclease (ribonuclease M5)
MKPAILDRLRGVQRAGDGWLAFCPAHADERKRSLSVKLADDGRTLVHCFAAGCDAEQIARACGMTLADLSATNGQRPTAPREVAVYDYQDERGELLYQVVRFAPKDFRPRRADGHGGWIWNLNGVRRVVYRFPELAEQRRVFLVEGEKDADNLVALGVTATTTPSGSQSWRDDYAAQIQGAGVEDVVIVPDNDQAGAVYAERAASALHARGLTVRVLTLPSLAAKGDVSDWLAAGHGRDELLALAAAAPMFEPSAMAPVLDLGPAEPAVVREGLDLSIAWPDGVRFLLTAIRDGREGVKGELLVTQASRRLSWGNWSLSSIATRETLRKKLDSKAPGLPWDEYVEDAAYRLTQAARQGEPLVTLTGAMPSPTRELLPRFLYEAEPTLIIGDGDTGKSLTGAAIAVAVRSGSALPFGLKPLSAVPVAYLDWETSRATVDERVAFLSAGLGIDPPPIQYKRLARPLVDEVAQLAAEFARLGIRLVIVDSMMFAVAASEGAGFHEPITAFYTALRLFAPAAVLVLSHVTGADARGGGPARPYGGAFAFNGPRLIWEAKRDKDVTDATAVAFTCIKANNLVRRPDPFGLRFTPGDSAITVYPFDLTNAAPQTVAGAPLPWRIRLALSGGRMTTDEVIEAVGGPEPSIRTTLRRLASAGKVTRIPGERKSDAVCWELPS